MGCDAEVGGSGARGDASVGLFRTWLTSDGQMARCLLPRRRRLMRRRATAIDSEARYGMLDWGRFGVKICGPRKCGAAPHRT